MKKSTFPVKCLVAAALASLASLTVAETVVDFSSARGSGVNVTDVLVENVLVSVPVANPFDPATTTSVSARYNVTFRFNPRTLHLEPVGLSDADSACATAEVQVNNAVLGQSAPVSGATVTIGGRTATTNSAGIVSIAGLPAGTASMTVVAPNYVAVTQSAALQCATTNRVTLSISPSAGPGALTGNQFRIILNWGQNPSDLDAHLTGPAADGTNRWHVYFGAKQGGDVCNLDVDDVTSYGPETITCPRNGVTSLRPGVYRYSVHHYTGSGSIGTSTARVRLEMGNGQVFNYAPPTTGFTGAGNVWTAFEITVREDGTTSVANVNTIGTSGSSTVRSEPSPTGGRSEDPAWFSNLGTK